MTIKETGQELLVMLSPTTRCNLACKYCYVDRDTTPEKNDMTIEDIKEAYQWVVSYCKCINTLSRHRYVSVSYVNFRTLRGVSDNQRNSLSLRILASKNKGNQFLRY